MTINDVKVILQGAFYYQKEYDTSIEKAERLRSMLERATPLYSQVPGGGGVSDKIGNGVASLVALKETVDENVKALKMEIEQITAIINGVPEHNYRVILQKRYLNFDKWEKICADLDYSWRHTHRLHKQALYAVRESIEKNYKPGKMLLNVTKKV